MLCDSGVRGGGLGGDGVGSAAAADSAAARAEVWRRYALSIHLGDY